jgi:hypothetical protein
MKLNTSLIRIAMLGGAVLSMAGAAQAQTVTLTSSGWVQSAVQPVVVGTPLFGAVMSSVLGAGTFGAGTLTVGNTTSVTFPSGFIMAIASGAGTSTGTATEKFNFNVAGGSALNVNVPITYTVANPTNAANAIVGINSTPVLFNVFGNIFSFRLINSGLSVGTGNVVQPVTVAGTITYVSAAPEPATVALFGLGLAPIAVAIRRRRK